MSVPMLIRLLIVVALLIPGAGDGIAEMLGGSVLPPPGLPEENGASAAPAPRAEASPKGVPAPAPVENAGLSPEEYRINAFDVLEISVYQEPDLNKTVRVSRDGFIAFPLIGKVQVLGMNIPDAQEKIAGLLAQDYLVDPNVTIYIREYNARKVFVMGEVKNPGVFIIPQDKELTVLELIALAGGFSPGAAIDGTKIIRMDKGIKKYIDVRISDVTKRGDRSKDIPLRPNDIVLVPERIF